MTGIVEVNNEAPVQVVREVDFQVVEVVLPGPPGPPGTPNPPSDGGDDLGTSALGWGKLYLTSGGQVIFGNDVTITHSLDLLTIAGGVVEFSSRPTFSGSGILASSDIGTTVQAWDADLDSWRAITRAAGFDTFVAAPSVANLMSLLTDEAAGLGTFLTTPSVANLAALLTDEAAGFTNFLVTPSVANLMAFLTNDAAGLGDFMVTPSSANLRTLVTDETGTGSLVFGTTPTFTTSMLLSSGFVMNWNASDVTLTHSADTLTLAGGSLVLPAAGLTVGASVPFSDSAGTLTLQNVDALDATTEATIEAAIDTLANLTSIQSRSVSLGGNITIGSTFTTVGAFSTAAATTISSFASTYLDDADAATTRSTLGVAIGSNVQAWDADLDSWALLTRAAGFDTFVVTPSVANLMSLLTNDAAGLGDFMVTPSSANLRTLVTDETGTGVLVFGTSPTFTTSMLLSSGFVMNWNASDVTLTHSADTLTLAGGSLVLPAAGLTVGASVPFSDSAGTLTLQNVDAVDATTEATIEAAIDTLANLNSIQGVSFTFGSYAATILNNTSELGFKQAVNLEIGIDVQAYDADLASWAGVTRAAGFDTFVTTPSVANLMSLLTNDAAGLGDFMVTPSSANLRTLVTDETGTGVLVFATSPSFTTDIRPATHDGTSLGTSALGFSDLFLGVGGVITWGAASTPDITITHATDTLTFAGGQFVFPAAGITVGASIPFSDSAGTLTLQNVDALDATTEATIEAAIDTLANLTNIQGVAFTFGSYAATILNNTSELGFKQAVNLEIGVDVQAYDADLASWAGVTRASGFDTFAATPTLANFGALLNNDPTGLITWMTTPSSANFAALITDETGSGAVVFGTAPVISNPDFTGLTDVQQTFALTGDISPAQITANQNDYNPTGLSTASVLRLTTDASRTITGLAGGSDGRVLLVHNVGTTDLVLAGEDVGSTAANRFALASAVTLAADQSAMLQYDATSQRWRMIGGTGSGGGGGGGGGGGDVSAAANFGVNNRVIRSDGSLKGVQSSGIIIDDTTFAMYPETNDVGTLGKATKGWADLWLASGAVIDFNSGDVTLTHSSNVLTGAGGQLVWTHTATPVDFTIVQDAFTVGGMNLRHDRATYASGSTNRIQWYFKDDGGTQKIFASIGGQTGTITAGAETGRLNFSVANAGTLTNYMRLNNGSLTPEANDGTALGSASLKWSDLFLASGGVINWENGDVTITHASNDLAFAGANQYKFVRTDGNVNVQLWYDLAHASPADVGIIDFYGRDTTSAATIYGRIRARCMDNTDASEDGRLALAVPVAGSLTDVVLIGDGANVTVQGSLFASGNPGTTATAVLTRDGTLSGGATSEVAMAAINHLTGVTYAERFGVPRNDTAGVDRTAALQAAIDNTTGKLILPPGRFLLTSNYLNVVARHGLVIEGQGPYNDGGAANEGTTIVLDKTSSQAFQFTNCIEAQLRNVSIVHTNTVPTSNSAITVNRTAGYGSGVLIENVFMENVYEGVKIDAANNTTLRRVQIRNIFGKTGVWMTGSSSTYRADILNIDGLACDNTISNSVEYSYKGARTNSTAYSLGDVVYSNNNLYKCTTAGTSGGSAISSKGTIASRSVTDGTVTWQFIGTTSLTWVAQDNYAYTLNVSHARLINGAYGMRMLDTAATGSSYPIWMRAYDVDSDHAIFGGVYLERGEDATLTDLWVSSVQAGNGVSVATTHRGGLRLCNSEINFSSQHGVLLDSGPTGNMIMQSQIGHNGRAANNTYHGIACGSTAADFQIIGNRLDSRPTSTSNNQAYGVYNDSATNNYYVIAHNIGRGSQTALVKDTTSNSTRVVTGNVS